MKVFSKLYVFGEFELSQAANLFLKNLCVFFMPFPWKRLKISFKKREFLNYIFWIWRTQNLITSPHWQYKHFDTKTNILQLSVLELAWISEFRQRQTEKKNYNLKWFFFSWFRHFKTQYKQKKETKKKKNFN